MGIQDLSTVVALLLAVSLATERGITILKTLLPKLLAEEKKDSANQADPVADRPRRFIVQVVAFVIAWITASFLTQSGFPGGLLASVNLGSPENPLAIPSAIIGLLASGGSAFWSSVLSYTSAAKDIKATDRARTAMSLRARAQALGLPPQAGAATGAASPRQLLLSQPPADLVLGGK